MIHSLLHRLLIGMNTGKHAQSRKPWDILQSHVYQVAIRKVIPSPRIHCLFFKGGGIRVFYMCNMLCVSRAILRMPKFFCCASLIFLQGTKDNRKFMSLILKSEEWKETTEFFFVMFYCSIFCSIVFFVFHLPHHTNAQTSHLSGTWNFTNFDISCQKGLPSQFERNHKERTVFERYFSCPDLKHPIDLFFKIRCTFSVFLFSGFHTDTSHIL